jgi:hypothetical protein
MIAAPRRASWAVTAGIAVGAATWTGSAVADTGPPPGGAAVDQYREAIPAAVGSVVSGSGGSRSGRLDPKAAEILQAEGGRDTRVLKRIATSPRYGAPASTPAPQARRTLPEPAANALPSAARAVGHADTRLGVLGAFLALSATGALGLRLRGRASRPQLPHG